MVWSKIGDDNTDTVYTSNEENIENIKADLIKVVTHMLEIEKEFAKTILIYTNSTNGFLRLACYNQKKKNYTGQYMYSLRLPVLWENSSSNNEGAFYFDKVTHLAICLMFEELMDTIKLYTSNELNSKPKILKI